MRQAKKGMKRKKAGLLSLRCHPCDRWWICSNMRHNCISLTSAICLLLFPFSLLLFPLLVSSQKKEIDRNLSYYIARKGQDTNWTREPCFYSFIYSCTSLKEWNATVGRSTTFPFSLLYFSLFCVYSFVFELCFHFPCAVKSFGALEISLKESDYLGEKEDESALLTPAHVLIQPYGWSSSCPLTRSWLNCWAWARI